ncbi:uncharacterized protein LOC123216577 isoform X2 [Mangifera indica]|uniref:uncharacterized protein LOC123216577 isoform X2 n=1 Tax=Mangifera indica TaxID=29780 RepID=UPI001CFBEA24|nr:uncharacterized protein LOC123216577 isoform X2 [Mangifera indica]
MKVRGKTYFLPEARVTALTCQWLMGPCVGNSVYLHDGTTSTCQSRVLVGKMQVFIDTCKLPTQTLFKEYMAVPLWVEPNFNDYSCQF